jgi:hypothetical protein
MPGEVPKVITFNEAIAAAEGDRALLLGNGFSIAQADGQFSYAQLLDRSGLSAQNPIRSVFSVLETADFEKVMDALYHTAQILEAYGQKQQAAQFRTDAIAVREALIHAVHEVHPGIQFDIPQAQRQACATFINNFSPIFTLNYDLLLYWVILNAAGNAHSDGFGLGQTVNGFRTFSEEANCDTYYLHGALHLFLGPRRETRKRVVTTATIIDDIAATIRNSGHLPLFVAEGSTVEKVDRINSVPYLRLCYEKLSGLSDNLFVFGHSVGENDNHIYDAVFDSSSIDRLFFFVHEPQNDWTHIRERLAPFRERDPDIDVIYVDSSSARVWG